MNRQEIKMKAKEIVKNNLGNFWRGYAFILILSYVLQFLVLKISSFKVFDKCLFMIDLLDSEQCLFSKIDIVGSIGSILITLIIAPLSFGFIYYILKLIRKENLDVNDIFKFKNNFLVIFILNLIIAFLTEIGYVFLIIPGIIISLNYALVSYVYADKQASIKDTLKESRELITGYRLDYLIFNLSFIGWMILSVLTFGVLLIWVLPYYQISQALYYENLQKIKNC